MSNPMPAEVRVPNWTAALLAVLEKAGWTYVQALIGLLLVGDGLGASAAQIAAIAAIPAGLTVVMNALNAAVVTVPLPWMVDLAWRTGRTFLATWLGLLVALPNFRLDYDVLMATASAALVSALAVAKGFIASRFGSGDPAGHGTPASLPTSMELAA